MKITIDIIEIIKDIFHPVILWLKEQELWEPISKLYGVLVKIAGSILSFFNIHSLDGIWKVVVKIVRFILDILLTFLDVLASIGSWVMNILK